MGETTLRYEVLGPLRVSRDSQDVALGSRMLRVLLATLLAQPNRTLSDAALTEAIWPANPPKSAAKNLHGYVYQLRQLIGAERIVRDNHGYGLAVSPGELDADDFTGLAADAARAAERGDLAAARALWAQAEGLWRGDALADLDGVLSLEAAVTRLHEARLGALEDRIDADLALGAHQAVAAELRGLVARHPFRERMQGQHMIALSRSGRRADALQAYDQFRRRLADELGVGPGEILEKTHLMLLRGDDPGPSLRDGRAGPAQLPPNTTHFTGREPQLARLDELLDERARHGGTVVVSAISGMGGVGKTALAVHWAHRVRREFPDGQLYINLNGYSSTPPLAPVQVLAYFLRALGVPPQNIPADFDAALSLYRTVLEGRRVLILLDNASSVDQVRPLMPASAGSLALVTTRSRMEGLAARDGAVRLELDKLRLPEALGLLSDLLGAKRIEAEPVAATDLVVACGYLPLALRVAAANLAGRPRLRLADLVAELRADRLGTLDVLDDPHTSVQAVLGRSYQWLDVLSRWALRLLAEIGWASFPAEAGAALLGLELPAARSIMDRLVDVHLLEQRENGRYGFHDLVRDYAKAARLGHDDRVAEGTQRLLAYLRFMATWAHALVMPGRPLPDDLPTPLPTPLRAPALESEVDAMHWFDAERVNLVETIMSEVDGHPELAYRVACELWPFLNHAGHTNDWIEVFERLARSPWVAADQQAEIVVLNSLGGAWLKAGDYEKSAEMHRRCLALREALHDDAGAARSHGNLGLLQERLGRYQESIWHYERSMELARGAGDRQMELAIISGGITGVYFRLGDYQATLRVLLSGLEAAREMGSAITLTPMLTNLGEVYRRLGQPETALTYLEESVELSRRTRTWRSLAHALGALADAKRDLGDAQSALELRLEANELIAETGIRGEQIDAMVELAGTYAAVGRPDQARTVLEQALALAVELGEKHQEGRAHLSLGRLLAGTDPAAAQLHLVEAVALLDAISPADAAEARKLLG